VKKVVVKVVYYVVTQTTQTVLGGLTRPIYHWVASLLQYTKNYENWLTVDKVIAK